MSVATPPPDQCDDAAYPPAAPYYSRTREPEVSGSFPKGEILTYRLHHDNSSELLESKGETIPNTAGIRTPKGPSMSSYSQGPETHAMLQGENLSHDSSDVPRLRSSNISEPPLKRLPETRATSSGVEGPLKRPVDDIEEIAYSDIISTFAVDVSGSTKGKVLEEEKDVIRELSSGLSRDAQTQAEIIPWNDRVEPIIRLGALNSLQSSGYTEPNSLNTTSEAKVSLSKCSAWFLLTDGEIFSDDIRKFSKGLCEASLHGTPCIIILFGYRSARPWMCNVSVGLSVFSNAPDCLFLFHDIDTTQVYILQSKGKFNALLPLGCHEIVLDTNTLWQNLPTFTYRQLFNLPLPLRQQLRADDILLQGGTKINLQDLYEHRITPAVAHNIMENDDNLKSVLLAAQLRGKDDEIGNWISKQKLERPDILTADRQDANLRATRLIQNLLDAMLLEPPDLPMVQSLQQQVRMAHSANWIVFLSSLSANDDAEMARDTVVSEAMMRIESNRNEMSGGDVSPGVLSPVSHTSSRSSKNGIQRRNRRERRCVCRVSNPSTAPVCRSHRSTNAEDVSRIKTKLGVDAGILFIKDYKYHEEYSNVGYKETCPICGQDQVLLTVLLKSPPKGLTTPGFPRPGERKGLTFPLAMGSYPETDILSSYVCCDSCAQTFVRVRLQVDDDVIIAAIPLMPAAFHGQYEKTTLNLIDAALERRFHSSAIPLVFLSIIYSTIAIIDGDKSDLRTTALRKMSVWISRHVGLPLELNMSITGDTPRTGTFTECRPLPDVVAHNLRSFREPDSPLLQHPLGGFIVFALIAKDLNFDLGAIGETVWHRFLFHLVEKHCVVLNTDQHQAAAGLGMLLKDESPESSQIHQDMESPEESLDEPDVSSIETNSQNQAQFSIQDLCGTHLLSEEELEDFKRLEALFDPVETRSSALRIFLIHLSMETPKLTIAMDIFDNMRAREDLRNLFRPAD